MTKSMTAFARETSSGDEGELTWEVRSVNHRFLEPFVRLPEDLRALEPAVRERLASRLGRGKVDCTLRFAPAAGAGANLRVNRHYLEQLLAAGAEVCVSVTLVDGLVLARSAFHHSVNYRSVVLFGTVESIADPEEKRRALRDIVEHIAPGRSEQVREPNAEEIAQTLVLAIPIDEGSAKVRSGPPVDDDEDYEIETWAGVLPLPVVPGEPETCPRVPQGIEVPENIRRYRR